MMQISISYEEFESVIMRLRNEIDEVINMDLTNINQDDFKYQYWEFETKCSQEISRYFGSLERSYELTLVLSNGFNSVYRELPGFPRTTEESKHDFKKLYRNLGHLNLLVELSDPFRRGISLIHERADLSVNEKKNFLLNKLYSLRRTDQYWSVPLIYELNEVTMDGKDEAQEIANSLSKSDYISIGEFANRSRAKITVKGKALIEKSLNLRDTPKAKESRETQSSMDIFISHSSVDRVTAKLLIDLIKTALNIPAKRIRCTSVDGYRLPAGASTDQQLRKEVNDCKVLIGIISPTSVNSAYVLFELGARWGISKPLIPLVTNQEGVALLKGPLGGINALNLSMPAQVHQLIGDLSGMLKVKPESAAVYLEKLEALVEHSIVNMTC